MVDPGPRSKKPAIFALVALVVLVATVAVVGVLVTRDGDDGTDWNAVVTLDRESSELVLYDDAGEEVDRIDPASTARSSRDRAGRTCSPATARAAQRSSTPARVRSSGRRRSRNGRTGSTGPGPR